MTGCVCDLRQLQKTGWTGVGVQFIFLWWWKKGECPCTWLAQWADSSVNDVTTLCLTYLNWLWCHSCLFHSVFLYLCPPSPSLIQLLSLTLFQSWFFLSRLSNAYFSLLLFFYSYLLPFSPFGKGRHTEIQSNGRVRQRWEEREEAELSTIAKNPIFRD